MRDFARALLAAAIPLAGGCDSPTGVPSQLPATLSVTTLGAPLTARVVGAGDSVVAEASIPYNCGGDLSAKAGARGGTLVVTVTDSVQLGVFCIATFGYSNVRVVARPVPPGTYPTELDLRTIIGDQRTAKVLARGTVALP